jgi:UDP-N-acetylmuramyl pentapeptide phosphotransferase/UDP-N-acetylglucosamine-1-phosphate transferase
MGIILFAFAAAISGAISRFLFRVPAMLDSPGVRSLHSSPTPRTGGIGIMVAVLIVGSGAFVVAGEEFGRNSSWWLLIALSLAFTFSLWDDSRSLSAATRLLLQAIVAILVVASGRILSSLPVPMLGEFDLGWIALPFTVLFVMWFMNLYNFMDGMDGFAGGMGLAGFGFLALIGHFGDDMHVFLFCLVLSGASLGFLVYNFPPAKIFMGDAGSISLGLAASGVSILGTQRGTWDIWVPLLVFSPFIVDATVTLFFRLFRGERVWEAHRCHFYQSLVLAGWGHRKTVSAEYLLMLACGASGVYYHFAAPAARLAVLCGWFLAYLVLIVLVTRIQRRSGRESLATREAMRTSSP